MSIFRDFHFIPGQQTATSISQPRASASIVCGIVRCPLPPRICGFQPIVFRVFAIFARASGSRIGLNVFILSEANFLLNSLKDAADFALAAATDFSLHCGEHNTDPCAIRFNRLPRNSTVALHILQGWSATLALALYAACLHPFEQYGIIRLFQDFGVNSAWQIEQIFGFIG